MCLLRVTLFQRANSKNADFRSGTEYFGTKTHASQACQIYFEPESQGWLPGWIHAFPGRQTCQRAVKKTQNDPRNEL